MSDPEFFIRQEGESRLARRDSLTVAYLTGNGWVEAGSKLGEILAGEDHDHPQAPGWIACDEDEAREYQRSYFSESGTRDLTIGGWTRTKKYFEARGMWPRRQAAPHGPAPKSIFRKFQREVQAAKRIALPEALRGDSLKEVVEQTLHGYEREEDRIDGIQQRATFFLGATGLTTSLVLVNGSLLYGSNPLHSFGVRIAVGVLLAIAGLAFVAAGLAALDATTITFDRALPNSAWQIEGRLGLGADDARRDLLAALLLAGQRAEAIGDWKLRQLKGARLLFALGMALVVIASIVVLIAVLTQGSSASSVT